MVASTRPKTLNDRTIAAITYADRGWPVFPLKPNSKRPATPKHPISYCDGSDPKCINGHTGWEQRATTLHPPILSAWQQNDHGVAIACGPANLLVVDLDIAKNGEPSGPTSLGELERKHGQYLPDTYTVVTPSGGYHFYYRQPQGDRLGNTANKVGPGIDTRGHGGYVAAPPTRLVDHQHPYRVLHDRPVVDLPKWFSELLTSTPTKTAEPLQQNPAFPPPEHNRTGTRLDRYVTTAINLQLNQLADAPPGQRNHTLFVTALALGQLVGANVAQENAIIHQIRNTAATHVNAGAFTWAEVDRTITSGINKGIQQPRTIPAHLTN